MPPKAISDISKLVQLIEDTARQDRGDSSRMMGYLHECRQLGVVVLPLDVNKSEAVCTIEEGEHIRLGFSLVLPKEAQFIEDILAERQQQGYFRSFQDFCERIALDLVPEDFIIHCIQAGAFDSVESSRSRLFLGRKKIMQAVRKAKTEKATGQISLFALLPPSPKGQSAAIELPEADEWTDAEIATHEKEATGFSFSEHLLHAETDEPEELPAADRAVAVNPTEQAVAANFPEQTGGLPETELAYIEPPPLPREEPPLVLPETALPVVAEPPSGQTEQAAREQAAEQPVISPTAALPATALPDDEEPPWPQAEFAPAESAAPFPPEEAFEEETGAKESLPPPAAFFIQLSTRHTTEQHLLRLREIVGKYPGATRVMLEFSDAAQQKILVGAHPDYAVAVSEALIQEVEALTGAKTTKLQAVRAQP